MYLNNIRFFIRDTIGASDAVGTSYRVSNDFELDEVIDTTGSTVSITLKSDTQIERFEGTFSAGNVTFTRRGIGQSATISTDTDLQKQWIEGSIGVITAFASDLYDAQEDLVIADGQQIEFGTDATTIRKNGTNLEFRDANNAPRTLQELSQSGSNDQVRVTNNDATPSVLDTKITAGNGITKTVENPGANETLDFDLDVDTTNGLTIGAQLGVNLSTNTAAGTIRIATDAEAATGTIETVAVNPSQLPKVSFPQTSRVYNAVSGTIPIPHGLGTTPKYVEINGVFFIGESFQGMSKGYSDGTNNACSYIGAIDGGAGIDVVAASDSSNCINYRSGSSAASAQQTATITLDSTNINIIWTYNEESGSNSTMEITMLAST